MLLTGAQAPAQNLASNESYNREKKFYLRNNDLFKELGRAPSTKTLRAITRV